MIYRLFWKRFFDIVISVLCIALLFLPSCLLALIILAEDGFPILFKQERYGKDRKPFLIYKFRTMKADAPSNVPTSRSEAIDGYVLKSGSILRRYSLDELPQLLNILKGDMSLVGPRPVILNETNLISERQNYHANSIRPGLTGWAQVNGRDLLDAKTKAKYDGEYTQILMGNGWKALLMDLKCIFRTFMKVPTAADIVSCRTVDSRKKDPR